LGHTKKLISHNKKEKGLSRPGKKGAKKKAVLLLYLIEPSGNRRGKRTGPSFFTRKGEGKREKKKRGVHCVNEGQKGGLARTAADGGKKRREGGPFYLRGRGCASLFWGKWG